MPLTSLSPYVAFISPRGVEIPNNTDLASYGQKRRVLHEQAPPRITSILAPALLLPSSPGLSFVAPPHTGRVGGRTHTARRSTATPGCSPPRASPPRRAPLPKRRRRTLRHATARRSSTLILVLLPVWRQVAVLANAMALAKFGCCWRFLLKVAVRQVGPASGRGPACAGRLGPAFAFSRFGAFNEPPLAARLANNHSLRRRAASTRRRLRPARRPRPYPPSFHSHRVGGRIPLPVEHLLERRGPGPRLSPGSASIVPRDQGRDHP